MSNKPTGAAGRGQPTGWDAQPHGWESDEIPAARLEESYARELPLAERHAYCERLSKFQGKGFGISRVPSWTLFYDYNIEETLKNNMKYEYIHDDRDDFVDYSWERALSIYGDVYSEWCLEFFLMMYFDKRVDRTKLMTETCIWFRLCEFEKVLTIT
ncbi:hypothetical protein Tco_1439618 [Tanacetum coccineum]